jgi:predicted nucleic acid-binding protein
VVIVDANVLLYAVDSASAHHDRWAIEHGADVVSYDRDFARFPGVRHRLPD